MVGIKEYIERNKLILEQWDIPASDGVLIIKPLSLTYELVLLCLYLGLHKPHFFFASWITVRLSQKGVLEGTGNLEGGKETHFSYVSYSCHHHIAMVLHRDTDSVSGSSRVCSFADFLHPRTSPACSLGDTSSSWAPTLPQRSMSQHHRAVSEKRGNFSPCFTQFQCVRILVPIAKL